MASHRITVFEQRDGATLRETECMMWYNLILVCAGVVITLVVEYDVMFCVKILWLAGTPIRVKKSKVF